MVTIPKLEYPLRWYWSEGCEPEICHGDFSTREEAIAAAEEESTASHISILLARPNTLNDDFFDVENVLEEWSDANEDYQSEEGELFMNASLEQQMELKALLGRTMAEWRIRHRLGRAWTLEISSHEILANPNHQPEIAT